MAVTQDVYEEVMNRDGWCCRNCGSNNCLELHHRLSKSKRNRARFPLFVDSTANLICLCRGCHITKTHLYKISDLEAERFELLLEKEKEKHGQ